MTTKLAFTLSLLIAAVALTPAASAAEAITPADTCREQRSETRQVTLNGILSGVGDPILLSGCTATWECGLGTCPTFLSCSGTDCSAGPDGGGFVECDGNRRQCASCSTTCCTQWSWQLCDRHCRFDLGGTAGYCDNGCCACEF